MRLNSKKDPKNVFCFFNLDFDIWKLFRISSLGFSIFILSICVLMNGCAKKQEAKKEVKIIPVRVMKVELKDITEALEYVGDIDAKDKAMIYPRVGGKIIEKLKEEGDSVKKGDVIAYIDRDEVGFKFENAPVEAPLEGIIGRVYVDKGTQVDPQSPIALVVDMGVVTVDLDIPQKHLPRISIGQTADIYIDAYPNERFTGVVSRVSPIVELDTRTAPVEIRIENKDLRLKPGMFAKVRLVIATHKDVPVILKEAIMGKDPQTYIYTINADNKALLKKVKLGIKEGPYVEVKDGLNKDEVVVIMGQQKLRDGVDVNAEEYGK